MPRRNKKHLPSLGSFATFEVAAKHLSFTAAAHELNVTQAAVSQHIRYLENALELSLFVRKHNCLELTSQGNQLFKSVSEGLDSISSAVMELSSEREQEVITFSATLGAASHWLKPLIKKYNEIESDVRFVVLASDEDDTLRKFDDVDLSLLCGNERCEVGEELYYLFPEVVKPVCSPTYLERFGPFNDADSLNSANLLHLHEIHWSAGAIGWQPITWAEWFQANGIDYKNEGCDFVTNNYPILVDAAIAGEGVILGWQHMVSNHIENGRLCIANNVSFRSQRGNFLRVNHASRNSPVVMRFLTFLLQQYKQDEFW